MELLGVKVQFSGREKNPQQMIGYYTQENHRFILLRPETIVVWNKSPKTIRQKNSSQRKKICSISDKKNIQRWNAKQVRNYVKAQKHIPQAAHIE